jgi:hypothetical protein
MPMTCHRRCSWRAALLETRQENNNNESTVVIRYLSIAAIVIGVVMEIFFIGSEFSIGDGAEFSLGTGIAAFGVIGFVYDFYSRQQGPKP